MEVPEVPLEDDDVWKNPDKNLKDQISPKMLSQSVDGLKISKISLINVETKKVFGLVPGDVKIQ